MVHVDQNPKVRDQIIAARAARKASLSHLNAAPAYRLSFCAVDDMASSDSDDEESTIQGHDTAPPPQETINCNVSSLRHASTPSISRQSRPMTSMSFRRTSTATLKPLGPPPATPLPPRPDSSLPPTPTATSRLLLPSSPSDADLSEITADELYVIRQISSCFPSPGPTPFFLFSESTHLGAKPSNATTPADSFLDTIADDSEGEYEDVLRLTEHRGMLREAAPVLSDTRPSDASRRSSVVKMPRSIGTHNKSKRLTPKDSVMQRNITELVAALDLHADQLSASSRSSAEQYRSPSSPTSASPNTDASMPSLTTSSSLDLSQSLQRTKSSSSLQTPSIAITESKDSTYDFDTIYDAYRPSSSSNRSQSRDEQVVDESGSPRKRTRQNNAVIGLGFEDQRAVHPDNVMTRSKRLETSFDPSLQSTAKEPRSAPTNDPYAFYEFSPSLPPFVPSGLSPKDLTGTGTWSSIVARAASHSPLSRRPSMATVSSVATTAGPVSLRDVKANAQAKQELADEERRQRESLSGYVASMTYRPFALHDHAFSLANGPNSLPSGSLSSHSNGRTTSQSSYSYAASSMTELGTRWPLAIGQDQFEASPAVSFEAFSFSRPQSYQQKQYVEFSMQTSPTSSPVPRKLQLPDSADKEPKRSPSAMLRRKSSAMSLLKVHGLDLEEPSSWLVRQRAPRLSSPRSTSLLSRADSSYLKSKQSDGDESDESDLDVDIDLEVLAERSGIWDTERAAKRKLGYTDKLDSHSSIEPRQIASIPQRATHLSTEVHQSTRSASPNLELAGSDEEDLLTQDVNLVELEASHASLTDEEDGITQNIAGRCSDSTELNGALANSSMTLLGTPNTTANSEVWSTFTVDRSSTASTATSYSVRSTDGERIVRRISSISIVDCDTTPLSPVAEVANNLLPSPSVSAPPRAARLSRIGSQSFDVPVSSLPKSSLRRPQSTANLRSSLHRSSISVLPSSTTAPKLPALRMATSTTLLRSKYTSAASSPSSGAVALQTRSRLPIVGAGSRIAPSSLPRYHTPPKSVS